MKLCGWVLCVAFVVLAQAKVDDDVKSSQETLTDPCSCALLNFWDIRPREDATNCCEALKVICYDSKSTLHCGHVYRFCLKRRAGFSAYILDEFVRTELRYLKCDAFNPRATHEAEKCGGGYCRIGYTCQKVKAEKCLADGGLVCGHGYCNSGAECAEMSSQTCKRFKKESIGNKNLKGYEDPTCDDTKCEACKTITEFKCAFKTGMTDPCNEKGCARGRRCEVVEEEVCVIRPDAALYINGDAQHAPEKVKKKFRRFTAVLLPVVGVCVAGISVIAFISWATVRVRRARKEVAGFADDSDNESSRHDNGDKEVYEKDMPLSPQRKRGSFAQNAAHLAHSMADILSPRLRLSTTRAAPYDDEHTPLSGSRTPKRGRIFTPTRYSTLDGADSFSDGERTPKERDINRYD